MCVYGRDVVDSLLFYFSFKLPRQTLGNVRRQVFSALSAPLQSSELTQTKKRADTGPAVFEYGTVTILDDIGIDLRSEL